ncbi:MAG: aminoacyl-tRNA hydrolase [Acidobacteriota bacterium]|jgi:PTH1 family peptidyl-tRNA hydrolase
MDLAAIIGLGNPGVEYANSRHNIGFRVVDALAGRWRVVAWQHRYSSLLGRRGGARPLWLVKPQTYMNLSGSAVTAFCRAVGLEPGELLVVVDDVDLPLGSLRLRARGGAGTHNGLRSVVEGIGEGFPRLRLGVRGETPWRDLAQYVLAPFEPAEVETVETMVARACECVEAVLHQGLARAATTFNASAAPRREPPEAG